MLQYMSYSGKSWISARARIPRSRAEVICSSAGSPFGLTQCDCVMPRFWLVRIISAAKPSIEPPTPSASTTAMSLADFTISIFSALSTVTWLPGLKPILDGACEAARAETVNRLSSVMRLFFTACSVTYKVISLDSEAGYHGTPAFSAYSTLPVSASISSAASVGDDADAVLVKAGLVRAVAARAAAIIEHRIDDTNFTAKSVLFAGLENECWFTRCFDYLNHRPGFGKSVPSCRPSLELGSWFTVELEFTVPNH